MTVSKVTLEGDLFRDSRSDLQYITCNCWVLVSLVRMQAFHLHFASVWGGEPGDETIDAFELVLPHIAIADRSLH